MANISKKRKAEILQERFPEFYELSQQLGCALDVLYDDLEEKLDKIQDIKDKLEEVEQEKMELDL